MTITELCEELHNWFDHDEKGYYGVLHGTFTIENENIDLSDFDFLLDGQYFHVTGSVFNNGAFEYGKGGMRDETFTGTLYAMIIPQTVFNLLSDINKWIDKYGDAANSPFSSESFGGYSYTKAGAGEGDSASGIGGWQFVFDSRLNKWRKI